MSVDYKLFKKSIANLKDANKEALIRFFEEYDGTAKTLRTLKSNPNYRFINDVQNSSGVIGLFESIGKEENYASIKPSLMQIINSVIPGNAASDSSTSSQNLTNNDDNTDNQNIVNLINAILKTIHDNPNNYDYGAISFNFRNQNPKDKSKLNTLLYGLKQFMDLPENKEKKASDLETTFWKNSLLTLGASTMHQQTNCDALKQEIANLQQQLAQSQKEAADCKTAREQLEAEKLQELDKLRKELAESNTNFEQLRQQLTEAQTQLSYEQKNTRLLTDAHDTMLKEQVAKYDQLNSELDQLKAENQSTNAENASLKTVNLELTNRIQKLEEEAKRGKSLTEKELIDNNEKLKKLNAELAGKIAGLESEQKAMRATIDTKNTRIAQLELELDEAKAAVPTTPAVVDQSAEIKTLTAARDAAIKERDAAKLEITRLTTELAAAKTELSKLQSQISTSTDKQTIADLQAQLKASEDKVLGLTQDITDLQEALKECTNKPAPTTEIKSPSGSNIALTEGMVYIFQETRPLKIGGNSATRRIKLEKDELFVEDENNTFQKFDQQFYKDMYVGGEDDEEDAPPSQIDEKRIIEAVKNIIPKT